MKTLLIVHHTPSPAMQEMFEAVLAGASAPEIDGVEVVRRPALTVSPVDMLEADGYLLGTPANLGYMSGALKHAFDVCYYPCLDTTRGRHSGCISTAMREPKGPSAVSTPSPPGWAG
jgi:multimeric flavodoxin WrbA